MSNKFAKARTNSISQVIVVVSHNELLSVEIECVRNCQGNFYAVDQVLHLRAVCLTCTDYCSYKWTLNGVDAQQNKKRLVTRLAADLVGQLTVKLSVMDQAGNGNTELKLQQAQPPQGGSCTIQPSIGEECITKFHISCQNYASAHQEPILYTFRMGHIYVENINSGETFLYLNGRDLLTVRICTYYLACTDVQIPVTVLSQEFNETPNIVAMLREGRRQEAFCVLHRLSFSPENMTTFTDSDDSFRSELSFAALEMVNSLEIANNSLSTLKSSERLELRVVSHIIKRADFIFNFVREDTEILDLTEDICLDLGKLLTYILTYFTISDREILELNSFLTQDKDLFHGVSVNWTRLDHNIVLRVSTLVSIVKGIFSMWHKTGEQLTRYIQPEEPFDYVLNNISYRVEMHDAYKPIEHESNNTSCYITSSLQTIKILRKMLQTNYLLFYTWCFTFDIFWWVPRTMSPTSATIAFNIMGRNSPNNDITAKSNKLILFKLGLERLSNTAEYEESNVIFDHAISYKLRLQGKANLVVKLLRSSADLRVLVAMNVKPVLRNIYDQSFYFPKGFRSRTIILNNHCREDGIVYVLIYKVAKDPEPANFSLRFSAQKLSAFDISNESPRWVKVECNLRTMVRKSNYSQCQVHYLSIFSAAAYKAEPMSIKQVSSNLFIAPLNLVFVMFYCLIILGVIVILSWVTLRARRKKKNLIRVIKWKRDEEDPSTENIIVHLQTGGRLLSSTTANVKLIFISDLGRYKAVIYQNPVNPYLELNTSCMLRLSDRRVQLPCRLIISHDTSGRFPSWYCRSIQVDDLRNNLSYTFLLHCWIRRGQKVMVSCNQTERKTILNQLHRVKDAKGSLLFIRRFRYYIRFYFTDWFMMQPLFGPWRYTDESLDVYQRTCIWLFKAIITITVVVCFYRKSTFYNSFKFQNDLTLLGMTDFVLLAFGSYMLTLLLTFCLQHTTQP